MPVDTENLGLSFERALCKLFNVEYTTNSRNAAKQIEMAESLYNKFPEELCDKICTFMQSNRFTHSASKSAEYDFTSECGSKTFHVKTNQKKFQKIAPAQLGQPSPQKFAAAMGFEYTDDKSLTECIRNDIERVFVIMCNKLFSAPIVYYQQHRNQIMLIKMKNAPALSKSNIVWGKTVMKYNKISIMEWQIHTTRKNMANRFYILNLLESFPECFEVEIIQL